MELLVLKLWRSCCDNEEESQKMRLTMMPEGWALAPVKREHVRTACSRVCGFNRSFTEISYYHERYQSPHSHSLGLSRNRS